MIELKNVSKSFDGIEALKNVSVTVREGEVFGLIGTNGAGKSTLLRVISGVLKPDTGMALIDGENVYENPQAKAKIFFLYVLKFAIIKCSNRYYGGNSMENITKEQLDELEENIFLSDFHATKGNAEQMVELDNKFHEILYTASGSRELRHVLSDFHHYAQRVRKITLSDKNRAVDSNNEHRRIVEALKQHDAQLAEKLANQHIMKTIENMDHYGWDNLLKK